VQIALGHYEEGAGFIKPALEIADKRGLLFRVAELSIAQSLICYGLGDLTAAMEYLNKALEISARCGYSRFFNDGPELDRLLILAIEKKIHAQFVVQLLASFNRTPPGGQRVDATHQTRREQFGLVVPLSEREREVLQLLAHGLAPTEIAKKLFLSPFTLKAHTQNIYNKLDVHSRIEAINKARLLGLL
jgi:LuxR family maltose regulon positive regulatory protein